VPAFFIPGFSDDTRAAERAYAAMRTQVELEMGRPPSTRRIVSLWSRRGRVDCVTEVGRRDPLLDGTVIAIFDMGARQPFVVCWRPEGRPEDVREILAASAYTVLEFDS
jgi:hypothetical protein